MNTMTTPRPVVVKQLPAQLKLGQVQEFLREVSPLITSDRPCIVFDFSQVTQIDSAGVDMLLHCMEQAMKRNGDLKLAAIPPSSAVILELTRVDRLFEVFETSSEAVDSFYGFCAPAQPVG
jgi:anti-sigma B factor antagonist